MASKLTMVLIKKEAEAYSSQGLHKEALKVYKDLLTSTPNLGDTFRGMIQTQMASIEQELDDGHSQEEARLSASEIKCIKEGWGADAPEGDILVCAEAFCRVGHHLDALSDVVKLLQKGSATGKVMEIFADCLVHLNAPNKLLNSVIMLSKKIYSRPQDQLRLYVLTTEAMVNLKRPLHAYALFRYLKQHPVISKKAPQRLIAIAKGIKLLREDQKKEAGEDDLQKFEKEIAGTDFKDLKVSAPPSHEAGYSSAAPLHEASVKSSTGWLATIKKILRK